MVMYRDLLDELLSQINIETKVDQLQYETDKSRYKEFINTLNESIENAKQQVKTKEIKQQINKYNKRNEHWNEELSKINRLKRFHSIMIAKYNEEQTKIIRKYYKQRMRHVYRRELKAAHTRKINKLNQEFMYDKSGFWQTIKNRDKTRVTVDLSMNLIEEFYNKVFNTENVNNSELQKIEELNKLLLNNIENKRHNIVIDHAEVEKIIKCLKNKKAIGHLKTENECFKYSNTMRMSKILAKFFQCMINNNVMIDEMNIGVIKLLIKDKKKSNLDLNNTRPITISDSLATIYEAIIMTYIKSQYTEAEQQMGFKSNSSTLHAVFTLKEQILHAHYEKKKLIMCFIDFSKAFDKINKDIMMYKLRNYVEPAIWASIFRYVKSARVYIVNKNEKSQYILVKDGVKQGGKASPMLFSMYIDEMIRILRKDANVYKMFNQEYGVICYADDTVIICDNITKMNETLKVVAEYCNLHHIKINGDKS
jgi:hypothetical protein